MADQEKKHEEEMKKKFTPVSQSAEQKKDSGNPGGGAGRVEDVKGSGVYPASGPLPKENAPYQSEASFGPGKRGAAGYDDSGDSEVFTTDEAQAWRGTNRGGQSREIPREQWVAFLDGFSRQHQGWLVDVLVSQNGQENQVEARELPLDSIAASLKHGDDNTISVILEQGQNQYLTHSISNTVRILVEKTAGGADAGLEIDAADGSKTFVNFRSPVSPETVDGMTGKQSK